MTNLISRYKLLYCFTWSSIYLFFPTWHLPIALNERFTFYIKLIIYFILSACLINLFLKDVPVDKSVIVNDSDRLKHIKNNSWLFILCCVAVGLHIFPLTFPIAIINEPRYTAGALWLYEVIDSMWHSGNLGIRTDFPIQYAVWFLAGMVILAVRTKITNNIKLKNLFKKLPSYNITSLIMYFFMVLVCLGYFFAYKHLFSWIRTSTDLLTDPPVSHLLYLATYLFFGPTDIMPRIVQLIFYVSGGIYLYRIISLFIDKEAALLGASIYLFSPLVFSYAHLSELAPGLATFVLVISFYYLRFIKCGDNRDLLLTSFFIGLGFLYKRDILLMLFICIGYLVMLKFKKRDAHFIFPVKVLSLSLIPIIPWFYIPRYFDNFRMYKVMWHHFVSPDFLGEYLFMIPQQLSWGLFVLFLLSIIYSLFAKKNHMSIFFGLVFIGYYLFYTADFTTRWRADIHRFSIVFYPTIAVFLSLLLSGILRKIKYKHTFKLMFSALTIYLICLSAVPSVGKQLITYKDVEAQHLPGDKAIQWIRDNVKEGERVLVLSKFFVPGVSGRLNEDYQPILKRLVFARDGKPPEMYSKPQELKAFCRLHKITYIMSPNIMYSYKENPYPEILNYLKENRNNEFTEVARFELTGNYIFIYKITENPDQ